jgi:hypothetical protein
MERTTETEVPPEERSIVTPPIVQPDGDGPSNGDLLAHKSAAEQISKIGTKNGDVVNALARIILYCKKGLEQYEIEADIHLQTHAAREEDGSIKTKTIEDGNGRAQIAVMKNQAEHRLAMNVLQRKPAVVNGMDRPRALKWTEITDKILWKDNRMDPEVIARLGIFVELPPQSSSEVKKS